MIKTTALILIFLTTLWSSTYQVSASPLTWKHAQAIASAIREPIFPDYTVDIRDFGALPDDGISDMEALHQAISQVNQAGGGTVEVPSGIYDTGAIELKSGVNLHLSEPDSVLRFSQEIIHENYPLVLSYYEGIACYNWSSLIYAFEQDNIAVTGPGRLDGQADENTWWSWYGNVGMGKEFSRPSSSDVSLLRKMNDDGIDVRQRIFGEGHYLRSNFIQMIQCRNVLIQDVTIESPPMWGINPVLCTSVTVRGVTIRGQWNNNDGCTPENSRLVLIENCCFQTGGDSISLKSGRGRDGWILKDQGHVTRDILIRNNEFSSGTSGIAFGSETSGDIRDIYAENNYFGREKLDYGIRFKSNGNRGGVVHKIYIRNSYMDHIRNGALHGTVYYGEGWNGIHLPEFKDIRIENMKGCGGEYGIFLETYPELPLKGLELKQIDLVSVKYDIRAINWVNPVIDDVKINGRIYPRPMNVRASGILAPGHRATALASIPGGHQKLLTYQWRLKKRNSSSEKIVGTQKELLITNEMEGGSLTLSVTDEYGHQQSSMTYTILSSEIDQTIPSESIKHVLSRGYAEESDLNSEKFVSNRECARVLSRFWALEKSKGNLILEDVNKKDPDYLMITGVIEQGYMSLKYQNGSQKENVVYQNISNLPEDMSLFFYPSKTISRGEMGQIALLACGLPYEEMMTAEPEFSDRANIQPQYRSSVGVSAALGLVTSKEGADYMPEDPLTWGEFLEIIYRISIFNNR